jgi:hypothetical protein
MLRLEEKMEMQRPPTGLNDREPAILATTAKAPIKLRKRAFVEVAFRAARPSQDLFELGETLGIDLVSDNDQWIDLSLRRPLSGSSVVKFGSIVEGAG